MWTLVASHLAIWTFAIWCVILVGRVVLVLSVSRGGSGTSTPSRVIASSTVTVLLPALPTVDLLHGRKARKMALDAEVLRVALDGGRNHG